jgi:uncharacterized membrane-anchored protein YhcB (DUF1043 family)
MNGDAPATKQDVQDLRSELKQDVQNLRSELKQDTKDLRTELKQDNRDLRTELKQDNEMLRSEMHHIYDNLVERIADSETKLLQAFYNFADANNKRLGQAEANGALVLVRLASVENRVLEIEKRLNLPPTQ